MKKILEIENLKKYFPIKSGLLKKVVGNVKAVDGINFHIYEGEALGLVGESGSGKSTTGRALLRLIEPTEGRIVINGKDITSISHKEIKSIRKEIQMIFQDPYASLNPRLRVGDAIAEPMIQHGICSREESKIRVNTLLEEVGLSKAYASRFPHMFSGGQRQRIGIARALGLGPKIIVADEPVSALDVSVQAQVLNLFMDLKETHNLTYLFITHDLAVVKYICDRIAVMYLGKIIEIGKTEEIFSNPKHPYTMSLLSAIPSTTRVKKEKIILEGSIPSPSNIPKGCRFHTRCFKCMDICKEVSPKIIELNNTHSVMCHLYDGEESGE